MTHKIRSIEIVSSGLPGGTTLVFDTVHLLRTDYVELFVFKSTTVLVYPSLSFISQVTLVTDLFLTIFLAAREIVEAWERSGG